MNMSTFAFVRSTIWLTARSVEWPGYGLDHITIDSRRVPKYKTTWRWAQLIFP